jgi:hypothetical protein
MRKAFLPLLITLCLAGVGIYLLTPKDQGSSGNGRAAALIIGNHANALHISSKDDCIQTICKPINESGGFFGVILAEGEPSLIGKPVRIFPPKNSVPEALAARLDDPTGPFAAIHAMSAQTPKTPEVDYLKAIAQAATILQNDETTSCKDKTIYLVGSGLSTKGEYLNFARGVTQANYETLVAQMVEDGALPDLTGVDVFWYNFGVTAAPQIDISAKYIKQMRELWTLALSAAGAQSIEFKGTLSQGSANKEADGYPYVTPVPFGADEAGDPLIKIPVYFNENVLGFKPESATYRDGAEGTSGNEIAMRILYPHAKNLISSGQVVVICGTAWNDGTGDERDLSLRRAKRVRDDLAAMGVPISQLLIAGAGNLGVNVLIGSETVDFYHPDNPEASRSIHIIPTNGGMADDVLARFGSY